MKRKRFTRKRRGGRRKCRKVTSCTVRRMIARTEETKFIVAFSGAPVVVLTGTPFVGIIAPLCAQGTSATQRTGQKVTIIRLGLRFACDANVAQSCRIRVMVVRDKQTNAAAPPTAQDWFADKAGANSWYSGYDPNTVGPRYQILMDRSRKLDISGGATDRTNREMVLWRKSIKIPVLFNGLGGGGIADIVKNGILIAVYTDAVANGPSIVHETTCWYKDA